MWHLRVKDQKEKHIQNIRNHISHFIPVFGQACRIPEE